MTYYIRFTLSRILGLTMICENKVPNVILLIYRKAELVGCNGPLGPLGLTPEDAEMLIPNENPGMSTKIV